LSCLYDITAPGHSTRVGDGNDQDLFGKWESTGVPPKLDACGGHYGVTPESDGEVVYHYHVQDTAPFTFGCWGPNDDGSLFTVAQCRDFYDGCGDDDVLTVVTEDGAREYDAWCPCYDANGNNPGDGNNDCDINTNKLDIHYTNNDTLSNANSSNFSASNWINALASATCLALRL